MLSLKSKIYSGLGVLILIIILLSFFGTYFLKQLSDDSASIIQDNYHSIDYTFLMLQELDNIHNLHINISHFPDSDINNDSARLSQLYLNLDNFEKILLLQKNNVTEEGEKELVVELISTFKLYKNKVDLNNYDHTDVEVSNTDSLFENMRSIIHKIYRINMNSILRKNVVAENTSSDVRTYMTVISLISLIIILFYLSRFPNYIISPIMELTNRIRAISTMDYNQKISIRTSDEIGVLTESFNIMADKLREYENQQMDKLLVANKRMEGLVDRLNDGVILLDENYTIIIVNCIAEKILNLNKEELLGKHINDFIEKSESLKIILTSAFFRETSKNDFEPVELNYKGEKQYFNIDVIKISLEHDNIERTETRGQVLIIKNITQYKERDIAKTNLLATVSHELKTPISSINLSLKLLFDIRIGIINEEQKKLLSSISQQNKRLLKMVNELLDYSQTETGIIELLLESIDPTNIIDLATSALLILLAEKEINLQSDIDDNLPFVKADLEKSVWILVNILSNAIRYSPQKGTILLSAKKSDGFITFSVADSGPGISSENINKIFMKFIKDKSGYFKGTGLGLAIAKEFVESQNGKIWVESEPGNGSRFYFCLPTA